MDSVGSCVCVRSFLGSDAEQFNAAIFDARHIKVAPLVCLAGYLFIIYAIIRRPKTAVQKD